jgi:hypothetical protein
MIRILDIMKLYLLKLVNIKVSQSGSKFLITFGSKTYSFPLKQPRIKA